MPIWRFQVLPKAGQSDTIGRQFGQVLRDFGVRSVEDVRSSRIYLIDAEADEATGRRIADELLLDPVTETCSITRSTDATTDPADALAVEVHFKPGVMDNVAQSTQLALADMGVKASSVRTARRYEFRPIPSDLELPRITRLVGNSCIEDIHIGTAPIKPPAKPPNQEFKLRHVAIRELDRPALERLSREGHLFLSIDEMLAIQSHYRAAGRDPTDLELESLAQTWSEHCVHKTLKSAYVYRGAPFPGHLGTATAGAIEVEVQFENLLRDTIARSTKELMAEGRGPTCLSVFVDNAGVIAFDDDYGIAFKVETHNHPSAIEPYGGASTGVGGVIRDILGCGLGAKPVANTDVFCVAPPDWPVESVPKGVIHPKTVLRGVVAGVRDYGNRMGIPTVNGAVHFDPRYLGNPLVYCGCVGLIRRDRIEKAARPGDAIVVIGGRTGRDGIHGATFSSAELTATHEDEFAHAVQIGNAIEEKKVLDLVLAAAHHRDDANNQGVDRCLFSAITDCGAGGLSSAVGEMAAETGAEVHLDRVPLKYAGLRYDEIWISEAQERMVLSVPEENLDTFMALARRESVEATVIGQFTDSRRLVLRYNGIEVGNLDMKFLHDGVPKTQRVAEWRAPAASDATGVAPPAFSPEQAVAQLTANLSNEITASKHWIFRQYDHEVQSGSVVKPWTGPGEGPTDAAVIRPRLGSDRGVAVGCGLAPALADVDPYWMAVAAIDEAIRNIVCVGGDPTEAAVLDNFCWPSSEDVVALGALVRACQACYDVAKAYGVPFISGKDSLNNVFALDEHDAAALLGVLRERHPDVARIVGADMQRRANKLSIPTTLLISAVSIIEDVNCCIQSVPRFKSNGHATLYYVGTTSMRWPDASMEALASLHAGVAGLIRRGEILAAHDVSDGGIATAVAEMTIAALGQCVYLRPPQGPTADPFATPPSAYIVQPREPSCLDAIRRIPGMTVVPVAIVRPGGSTSGGKVRGDDWLAFVDVGDGFDSSPDSIERVDWEFAATGPAVVHGLRALWRAPLDW
mgnify:CR=1 FL=1